MARDRGRWVFSSARTRIWLAAVATEAEGEEPEMEYRRKACGVVILTLAVLTAGVTVASGEQPSREEELARELLEVSGGGALGTQVMTQMIQSFRTANPEVPGELWDRFLEQADPQELEDMVLPIYVKHLTAEEMEASIAFYSTPIGQSILEKLPVVMQESMQAGQQWGMKLGQQIAEELEARREAQEE